MVRMRAVGALPDGDPLLHVCVAAYASDMSLLVSVLLAQRLAWAEDTVTGASPAHATWFHAPVRARRLAPPCQRRTCDVRRARFARG